MKIITFLCLTFIFLGHAYTANLNLSSGESAFIQPNAKTLVSCGNAIIIENCSISVQTLDKLLQTCVQSYGGGTCVDKIWPNFIKSHNSCYDQAIELCLNYCKQSYGGGTCVGKCSM